MAPIGKRTVSALPPQAQFIAQQVDRLGFADWRFIEDYPLPDPAGGIQVRDQSSLAPGANVNLYAENMTAGHLFPPVVTTADGYQIDGRTRNLAKRKITRKGQTPVFDTIVLRENFEGATTAQMGRFYALATVLNRHGEKLTDRNIESIIGQIWQDDMSQTDLARTLGVHANTVKAVVNAKKARERLEELNETLPAREQVDVSALNRTTLAHFETKGRSLYNRPLVELAQVAAKVNMPSPEVAALMNELNELHEEPLQLELLEGVRQARKLQIDGVTKRNPLATQTMQRISWLAKYQDNPSALAETGGDQAKQDMVKKSLAAIAVLRKLVQSLENELSGVGR